MLPRQMTEKSSEDLDLSAYEDDVELYVLRGLGRMRMLDDLRGDKPWNVDLAAGTLQLGEQSFEVQILGTFSASTRTFLWAWANPGAVAWGAAMSSVNELRSLGERKGYAVFRTPKVAESWVHPRELAPVAAEIAGDYPVFVGAYDGGEVYLMISDVDLDLDLKDFSLAYIPGILLQLSSITVCNQKACAKEFGEHLGFTATDGSNTTYFTRGDDSFDVTYDESGRIQRVSIG